MNPGTLEPTATNLPTWVRRAAERINWLLRYTRTADERLAAVEASAGTLASDVAALDSRVDVLEQPIATRTVAADHDVEPGDQFIAVDAAAGDVAIDLPAVVAGRMLWIKKIDASANEVTVAADGSDLVDGAATLVIDTQYDAFTLLGTTDGWWIV